jgi:hypothetical protein
MPSALQNMLARSAMQSPQYEQEYTDLLVSANGRFQLMLNIMGIFF